MIIQKPKENNMRILHICTTNNGGAGKAAFRLHLGLKSIGVKTKLLVLRRSGSSNSDVVEFTQGNNILKRAWNRLRNGYIFYEFNAYKNTRPKGLDLFSNDRAIYEISKHPFVKETDIINLYWITGMVDYRRFFSNIHNKPIVWRLSDMNPFTGGCHYSGGCTKYQTGCGACPQLGSEDLNDLSRKIFKRKENAYNGKIIHIVTPSKWLGDCAKRSLLFKGFPIEVIPNGVPTDIFTKRDKQFSRDLLNLPRDKILILFGDDYRVERKGFKYLLQALELLKERIDPSKMCLVTFGPKQYLDIFSKEIIFPICQLGYIHDEALLSSVYSSADIFMVPSLEDNLPNVMLESMACGTPVVGFNTGGIPDIITAHKTGLLAEVKNAEELSQKIEYMIAHPKEREVMGVNAIQLVRQKYAAEIQAEAYLKLYKMLLEA